MTIASFATTLHSIAQAKALHAADPTGVSVVQAARLIRFTRAAALFVVRSREEVQYQVQMQLEGTMPRNVICEEYVKLAGRYTQDDYPELLHRVVVHDPVKDKPLVLFTNIFAAACTQVAELYKARWRIELFFMQHLRITSFIGRSENAVKIPVWTAISACVLVAIIKK